MGSYDGLGITDFDHIEFAVGDLEKSIRLYETMGFSECGAREIRERGLRSILMGQGDIWVMLSQSNRDADPVAQFVEKHGDGVISVGFRCKDAFSAAETAANRGAQIVEPPREMQKDFGSIQQSAISAFGDVRHTFVSRKGQLFGEGFETPMKTPAKGFGLKRIDHITTNVERGQLDSWSGFYERVFGMENTRFFDISTKRTGLYSKVMQSPDGIIKMPVNEPGSGANQIQEYIDVNHGAGVQHIALETEAIIPTLKSLRKGGISFLEAPPTTYYEAVTTRVKGIREDINELQELAILADGSEKGYLLQIFTQNVVGPFFYEVIQREGDDGFGNGNFTALFEAIERDQIRRGVLKA